MRIAIGCDDTGFPLKEQVSAALEASGHDLLDPPMGLLIDRRRRPVERPGDSGDTERDGLHPPDHLIVSSRMAVIRAFTRAWAVLSDARFTCGAASKVFVPET